MSRKSPLLALALMTALGALPSEPAPVAKKLRTPVDVASRCERNKAKRERRAARAKPKAPKS